MRTFHEAARAVTAFVEQHTSEAILAGLALTVLLLLWAGRKAAKSERPDKWLAALSLLVGFAWSAEAMWEVATQDLALAASFAVFAFFVFESQLAVSMMRAERHYRLHKHPGKHGRTAWVVAVVMGIVAGMAGDSPVEVVLRLVVPLLVTQQWWVGMTGDGVTKPADAITWNWSPRRILVAVGLARPGEHDLVTVDRERQILAIAKVSHRLHSTRWRWRRAWFEMRVRRLAMTADDGMLDAARLHVERVWRSVDLTRPIATEDLKMLAAVRAEAEAARTEAGLARAAEAAAVASAQAAHDLAEAYVARTAQIEAEAKAAEQRAYAEAARAAEATARAAEAIARANVEAARREEAEAAAAARELSRASQRAAVPAQRAAATVEVREVSGRQEATDRASSMQAERAEWIRKMVAESGRPDSEDGWANLTKAVSEKFAVSERTARRDVRPFKERVLTPAA